MMPVNDYYKYPLCLPAPTHTIPPLEESIKDALNKKEKEVHFTPSLDAWENARKRRLELLKKQKENAAANPYQESFWYALEEMTKKEPDEEKEEKVTEPTKPTLSIDPKLVGSDIVIIENKSEIPEDKKQVYEAIISAFEEYEMGKATLFMILQCIPYIEKVEDVIVVYLRVPDIFDKLNIPCINLASAIREKMKGEVKLRFIPFASETIAEYYSKNKCKK